MKKSPEAQGNVISTLHRAEVVEVVMEQSAPRVVEADRNQLELRPFDLDSTIAPDHRARLVWRAVETLDLRAFYDRIKARVGTAGRPPGDPKVFVALWLYATTDGVGSARELERLCAQHQAYRWLCGGVPVNHHTLSDFRVRAWRRPR